MELSTYQVFCRQFASPYLARAFADLSRRDQGNKRPGAEHRAKSGCRVFVGRTGCVHVAQSIPR